MEESKTYCVKDNKNKHCWISIGVIVGANLNIREVLKCTQCQKIITPILEEITRVYQEPESPTEDFA